MVLAFGSMLLGVVSGLASQLPHKYMSAMMSGQALGGVFPAVCSIASIAIGASPRHSAFIYFLIANVTILVASLCYFVLTNCVSQKTSLEQSTSSLQHLVISIIQQ